MRAWIPAYLVPQPRLVFHMQLVYGSTAGQVANFCSIQELYTKITGIFEILLSEV